MDHLVREVCFSHTLQAMLVLADPLPVLVMECSDLLDQEDKAG